MTAREQLDLALKEMATKLGCTEADLTVEMIRMLSVAVAEGNCILGKAALGHAMEKRAVDRAALIQAVATLQQRQQIILGRLEETRIALASALVVIRRKLGATANPPTMATPEELRQQLGCFRHDGTLQEATPKVDSKSKKKIGGAPPDD